MESVSNALSVVEGATGNFLTAVQPDTLPNVQEMYRTTLAAMRAIEISPIATSSDFMKEAAKLVEASSGFLPGSPEGAPRNIASLIDAAKNAHDIAERILHKLRGSPSPAPKTATSTPRLLEETFMLPQITSAAVAEDEPAVLRMTVRKIGKIISTPILTATDGGRFLDDLLEKNGHELEVLFLDNVMPGRHGSEAIKTIRAHGEHRKIVVIFLTADKSFTSLVGGEPRWKTLGFDGYLAKDFNSPSIEEIYKCLSEIFQSLLKSSDPAYERRWIEKYRRGK